MKKFIVLCSMILALGFVVGCPSGGDTSAPAPAPVDAPAPPADDAPAPVDDAPTPADPE